MKTARLQFTALMLFAFGAFAQDAAPKTVGEFAISLIPAVLALLSTAITALVLPALRSWLLEKAKTNKVANAALVLEHLAETAHAHVSIGMQAKLQAVSADGKITDEEKAECKAEAMRLLKEWLGKEGLDSLTGALGVGAKVVDSFLHGALAKAEANAAPAADPADPQ